MSEGDGLPLLLLLLLLLFHPIQPFPSQNPSKPEGKSETMRLGRYNVFRPRLKERTEMVFYISNLSILATYFWQDF